MVEREFPSKAFVTGKAVTLEDISAPTSWERFKQDVERAKRAIKVDVIEEDVKRGLLSLGPPGRGVYKASKWLEQKVTPHWNRKNIHPVNPIHPDARRYVPDPDPGVVKQTLQTLKLKERNNPRKVFSADAPEDLLPGRFHTPTIHYDQQALDSRSMQGAVWNFPLTRWTRKGAQTTANMMFTAPALYAGFAYEVASVGISDGIKFYVQDLLVGNFSVMFALLTGQDHERLDHRTDMEKEWDENGAKREIARLEEPINVMNKLLDTPERRAQITPERWAQYKGDFQKLAYSGALLHPEKHRNEWDQWSMTWMNARDWRKPLEERAAVDRDHGGDGAGSGPKFKTMRTLADELTPESDERARTRDAEEAERLRREEEERRREARRSARDARTRSARSPDDDDFGL
jgi:hypothetical protein